MKKKNTFEIVLTAFFLGIMILMSSVPFLGFIPIGPLNATILHIPVIIGSIVLGPKLGAFLGTSFGVMSVINATTRPSALSFVFSPFIPIIGTDQGSWLALIVAIVPRILIGVVPYYVYKFGKKLIKNKENKVTNGVLLFIAGVSGGLTNTLLVMNLIYFLFKDAYGELIKKGADQVYGAILVVIGTQGVPEAIVAGVLTAAIASILLRLNRKNEIESF